jgi:hypothetical protein
MSGKENRFYRMSVAAALNPILRGWMNYFGGFNKSAMKKGLDCVQRRLVRWAMCKYATDKSPESKARKEEDDTAISPGTEYCRCSMFPPTENSRKPLRSNVFGKS